MNLTCPQNYIFSVLKVFFLIFKLKNHKILLFENLDEGTSKQKKVSIDNLEPISKDILVIFYRNF